ncbi:MAG: NAD(P)/FAD-dependent oxidoreductase [Deltaproteobacteria bacterium]|nr:NAD(P)/FAD-dependent oxidoreductase [Deltaproteobacteria bacterium]
MSDSLIIGAGISGCGAAVQLKKAGIEFVLLDKNRTPGGVIKNAGLINNYPGFEKPITGIDFAKRLENNLREHNIEIHGETAQKVIREDKGFLVITDKKSYHCNNLLICWGTTPKKIKFKGVESLVEQGLIFYEVFDLFKKFKQPSRVLIAGGGEASMDYALSIVKRGGRADIICRSEKLKGADTLIEEVNKKPEIRCFYNTEIDYVSIKSGKIEMIVKKNQSEIRFDKYDAIIGAIGRKSTLTDLLTNIEIESGILNPQKGLYICGDARKGTLGQLATGAGDGVEAAMHIHSLSR